MGKLMKSRAAAWSAFIVLIALLVFAYPFLTEWWMFIPFFFAFMMVFSHLMAVMVVKLNARASAKLDMAGFIFGVLTIVGFLAVWILMQFVFAPN